MLINDKKLKLLINESVKNYIIEERLKNELLREGIAGSVFKYLKDVFVNGVQRLVNMGEGNAQIQLAMKDFIAAYTQMMGYNVIGSDKFFHCVANNMAARRGWQGKAFAIVFSELREITDLIKPTNQTFSKKLEDREEDLRANELGRETIGDPRKIINPPAHLKDDYLAAIDACRIFLPNCARKDYRDEKGISTAKFDGDFDACSNYIRIK